MRILAATPRLPLPAATVFVPIPLHPRRLSKRGFNQAAWFARALARRNRSELRADALTCVVDAPSRAQMTRLERRSASEQLFRACRAASPSAVAVPVDDVCTTGMTLCAARAVLEAAEFRVPFAVVLLSTERSEDLGGGRTDEQRGSGTMGEDPRLGLSR
jgi:predicted amidophosphoribosyltransferase